MKHTLQANDPPSKRLKRRHGRGKRKSKTERMAARQSLDSASSLLSIASHLSTGEEAQVGAAKGKETLAKTLLPLLTASASEKWDVATQLACRTNDPIAKRLVLQHVLFHHKKPRAAVVYATRLGMNLTAVGDWLRDQMDLEPVLVARFLVDFVGSDKEMDKKTADSMLWQCFARRWLIHEQLAAVQTLLHANDALKRTAVREFLATGMWTHLVNQYAHGFLPALQETMQSIATSPLASRDPQYKHQHQWIKGFVLGLGRGGTPDTPTVQQSAGTSEECNRRCLAERGRRQEIAQGLETLARLVWPDARVHLFGSSVTGLCEPRDDVDLCVTIPSACGAAFREETRDIVFEMHQHLAIYFPRDDCVLVGDARIPLVKLQEPKSQLRVDLCVNNLAAIWNTQLIDVLLHFKSSGKSRCRHESQVFRVAWTVKNWFRRRRLSSLHGNRKLSSYAVVLLVLFFFQMRGRLPFVDCEHIYREDLQQLQQIEEHKVRERIMEQIQHEYHGIADAADDAQPNDLWVLMDFFKFYCFEFDFLHQVVSLRAGDVTHDTKQWKTTAAINNKNKKKAMALCIEDPIETTRDLGKYLSRSSLKTLRLELLRVCMHFEKYGTQVTGVLKADDERERMLSVIMREKYDDQGIMLHGDDAWWSASNVAFETVDSTESMNHLTKELFPEHLAENGARSSTTIAMMTPNQGEDHAVAVNTTNSKLFLVHWNQIEGKEMKNLLLQELKLHEHAVHVVVFNGTEFEWKNQLSNVIDLHQEFSVLAKALQQQSHADDHAQVKDKSHVNEPGHEAIETLDKMIYHYLGVRLDHNHCRDAAESLTSTTHATHALAKQAVYLLPLYQLLVRKKRLVLQVLEKLQ